MGMKICCCCCCAAFAFVFLLVFFIAASSSVKLARVHHILEDVVVSNLTLRNSTIDSGTLTFKIWSRNANTKMGVHFWHMRIAVIYNNHNLGKAYVLPKFVQPPRNITRLQAPLQFANLTLPPEIANRLRADLESDSRAIHLKIVVKMRAKFKRVDKSWQTKLTGGELRADDKCNLEISLNSTSGSSLKGRHCGWTVRPYTPAN